MQTLTEQLVEALEPYVLIAEHLEREDPPSYRLSQARAALDRYRADPEALLRENGEAVRRTGNALMHEMRGWEPIIERPGHGPLGFPDLSCCWSSRKGVTVVMAKKKCIGFPKGPCSGVPNRNPYWCDECDEKRIDHITARVAALSPKTGTPT